MKRIYIPLFVLASAVLFQNCENTTTTTNVNSDKNECPEGEDRMTANVDLILQDLGNKSTPPLAVMSEENYQTNFDIYVCGITNAVLTHRWLDLGATGLESDDMIQTLPVKTVNNTIFVARYNQHGVLQDTKIIGNFKDKCVIRSIEKTHQNGYVVFGDFKGEITISGEVLQSSGNAGFVASYNSNNVLNWVRKISASSKVEVSKGFVTENALYFVGDFSGKAKFAPFQTFLADPITNLPTTTAVTIDIQLSSENSTADGFIAKYDLNGNVLWARKITSAKQNKLVDVEVWNETIYVTGYAEGAISLPYIKKSLVTIPLPNGTVDKILKLKEEKLEVQSSSRDCILANYSLDGNPLWVKTYGGSGLDEGTGVCVTANNELFVAGNFNSSVMNLQTKSGEVTVQNRGIQDVFRMYASTTSGEILKIDGLGGKGMDVCNGVYYNRRNPQEYEYMHGIFNDTFWVNTTDFLFDKNNGYTVQSGFVVENTENRSFGRSYLVTNGFFCTGMSERRNGVPAPSGIADDYSLFIFGNHLNKCSDFMNPKNEVMLSFNQENSQWKSVLWRIHRLKDVDPSGDPKQPDPNENPGPKPQPKP